jgi:putative tricarboxylic transport membrane protein
VLGDMAESSFRQSMLLSGGSIGIFWHNSLSGTIATLAILMLLWPLVTKAFGAVTRKPAT